MRRACLPRSYREFLLVRRSVGFCMPIRIVPTPAPLTTTPITPWLVSSQNSPKGRYRRYLSRFGISSWRCYLARACDQVQVSTETREVRHPTIFDDALKAELPPLLPCTCRFCGTGRGLHLNAEEFIWLSLLGCCGSGPESFPCETIHSERQTQWGIAEDYM